MEIIYQRANCDENGHIIYLGCCYKSKYQLQMSILDVYPPMSEVDRANQELLEHVPGSWPARIETKDGVIYSTTFFPLYAFRRSFDRKEEVLGYIEHQLY